jgi:dihydroorotate dehydrogenase electron transfer subunit
MIHQLVAPVIGHRLAANGIHVLSLHAPSLAADAKPGQFINVRTTDGSLPLLRRPFSIARVTGESIEVLFNIVGLGTRMMSARRVGDTLDLLGPLGVPFGIDAGFATALLVAGGVGVAPFPFLTDALIQRRKKLVTFLGARSADQIPTEHLENPHIATDDGSGGFQGTVVQLLERYLQKTSVDRPKIFGCGPTPMLKVLSDLAVRLGIPCELSLEGDMACGVGICQGCPVERVDGERKYALVCVEGPTFDCTQIRLA